MCFGDSPTAIIYIVVLQQNQLNDLLINTHTHTHVCADASKLDPEGRDANFILKIVVPVMIVSVRFKTINTT